MPALASHLVCAISVIVVLFDWVVVLEMCHSLVEMRGWLSRVDPPFKCLTIEASW
jgi:hypothetical protein